MERLYEQSLLVLAALEDKTHRGASIAAPSMPWIWGTLSLAGYKETSDPYHLVWPRDFYHAATAQKAAGDDAGADRLVDYLWEVQKPDGSFWQNTRVDGTPVWTSEQLDETSLPVVLAWWLGRTGTTDWDNIRGRGRIPDGKRTGRARARSAGRTRTATRRTRSRPRSRRSSAPPTSRGTTEIEERGRAYVRVADDWQAKVESWTATDNGPYSPKPYYLRVTKDASPNVGTKYNARRQLDRPVDQREIVDNSFLGLVLFGVKRHDDQTILNSLQVGDDDGALAAAGEHAQRPVLAALHVRRLRRAADGRRLGPVLRQPAAPDARARVAAAGGRARRVRADRRPGRERRVCGRSRTRPTTA